MKKLTLIFMLLLSITTSAAPTTNLIKNPSFEQKLKHWNHTTAPDLKMRITSNLSYNRKPHHGSKSLKLNRNQSISQTISINPKTNYLLSIHLANIPTKTPGQDNILKIIANNQHIATILPFSISNWEKFSFYIPAQNKKQLTLKLQSDSRNYGPTIDHISLTPTNTPPAFTTPTPTKSNIFIPAKAKSNPSKSHTPLFNGKDFTGWNGNTKYFAIKNKTIHAGNLENNIPHNYFLTTNQKYYNFNLQLDVKLQGKKHINGGVQIRSTRVPNSTAMKGYQVDILNDNRVARIYDEHRRNRFLNERIHNHKNAHIIKDQFNHYNITCKDARITAYLNGYLVSDYIEIDKKIIKQTGLIGLQIHSGPPAKLIYKNIYLKPIKP